MRIGVDVHCFIRKCSYVCENLYTIKVRWLTYLFVCACVVKCMRKWLFQSLPRGHWLGHVEQEWNAMWQSSLVPTSYPKENHILLILYHYFFLRLFLLFFFFFSTSLFSSCILRFFFFYFDIFFSVSCFLSPIVEVSSLSG